jgi:hypothetical protein
MWLPLVLTLLALAVRLQQITYHSLWFDEAMSVHWARSDVARILEVSMNLVEDRLPPVYYLLLHGWRLVWGDGELAVRLPSALLGALLVPVVYRLAAEMLDRRAAGLAAVLAAVNPFLVWYAQEARMYALAVLLSGLGTWCFVRASIAGGPGGLGPLADARGSESGLRRLRWWLGYGLCVLVGLYTHLYTAFVLPAHALYLVLSRRKGALWLAYAGTMLVVAALYAPLALATLRASSQAGPGDPLAGAGARVWALLAAFSVWKAPLDGQLANVITLGTGLLALVGLVLPNPPSPSIAGRRGVVPHPRLLIGLLLLSPLGVATLSLLRNRLAFFGERYFIVMLPWLLMAVAAGALVLGDWLRRVFWTVGGRVRSGRPAAGKDGHPSGAIRELPLLPAPYSLLPLVFCLLPVALAVLPLPGLWSPAARKEAWRETAAYLAANARPEDAILIHPDWTRYPFQYYFRGPGQTYAVFSSVDKSTDLETPLAAIGERHPVVWLVESHTEQADAAHLAAGWLAAHYPLVTELYPPGLVAVRAYAPAYRLEQLPAQATPVTIGFQGELLLAGYTVPQTATQATDELFHPPSAWLHVTLFWQAAARPGGTYAPFVHLVDDLGQVWGAALERAGDAFSLYPPRRWSPGQLVRADYDVNLNPASPPGSYFLVVGLRDGAGQQLPLSDGAPQAQLSQIEVIR